MKKVLLLLIIPFLSFGQEQYCFCLDEDACNYTYTPEIIECLLECEYYQDACESIAGPPGPGITAFGIAFWDDDCNCICENDADDDGVCDEVDCLPYTYNPDQDDEECLKIENIMLKKNLITTVDILGRETTKKGFQLHIYDDGTVEKKYLIK